MCQSPGAIHARPEWSTSPARASSTGMLLRAVRRSARNRVNSGGMC